MKGKENYNFLHYILKKLCFEKNLQRPIGEQLSGVRCDYCSLHKKKWVGNLGKTPPEPLAWKTKNIHRLLSTCKLNREKEKNARQNLATALRGWGGARAQPHAHTIHILVNE